MIAPGWIVAPLGTIADLYQGYGFPKILQGRATGEIGFYKVSDISRAVTAGDDHLGAAAHYISIQESRAIRASTLPKHAVVFARIGEAINLNRRALLPRPSLVDNNVMGAKAREGIDDRYLMHFLRTVRLGELSQATTVPAVRSSDIAAIEVPIAPTREQIRVVSKLDELFSRMADGERVLQHAHNLVKRYCQAVIKAAVTGELTREWRESRKDQLESGQAVLQRVLTARRTSWEKAAANATKGGGSRPSRRYSEPLVPDVANLPELPDGWTWASMDMLADVVGGITVDQKRSVASCDQVAYLRVANVQRGYLDLTEIKMIGAPKDRIDQLRLQRGDILFNEGGDLDKLGRGWIWEDQLPVCIHQNHVFRARLYLQGSWSKIISWYGNVIGRKLFLELGKQTTNLASLSLSKLKAFPVPVMSELEAAEIVSRTEDLLSVAEKQDSELSRQRSASLELRQSILKAAFAGRLVPQDIHDQPASAVLARLTRETGSRSKGSPRVGRKSKG